jgi:Fe-S cluster biogenesis protein NfuA
MVERIQVEQAINEVRPSLQADGGDIELVDVTAEGVVKVKLKGACSGCPMSQMTLSQGIERYLKKQLPDVLKVESV